MDLTTTLFLGDLSVYCTEQDIFEIFQPYGPIESVQLKRKSTPDSRPSYGFVTFRFRESADHALRMVNGRVIHGRVIRLGWAEPPKVNVKLAVKKSEPPHSSPSAATMEMVDSGKIDTAQVHFSYVTNKVDPLREDVFRNVFQHFGLIKDVCIKKSQYHPDKGVQTGYGFIHYPLSEEGIISAFEAVKSVHELVIDSVKYSCRVSHALEQYLKNQGKFGALGPGTGGGLGAFGNSGLMYQQQQQPPPTLSLPTTSSFSTYYDRGSYPPISLQSQYPTPSYFPQQELTTYGGLTSTFAQPQIPSVLTPQSLYPPYSSAQYTSNGLSVVAPPAYQIPNPNPSMDLIAVHHTPYSKPNGLSGNMQQQFPGGSSGTGGGFGGL